MPKKGNRKRLKFRAGDVCSDSVTVADYADADPAVVKSGRVKKAVANAVEKEEITADALDSSDDLDPEDDGENDIKVAHKKKNKRRKESSESSDGGEYPVDIWLMLASYIRPEDECLDSHMHCCVLDQALQKCLLFWVRKVFGTRPEALWEFNFKFLKQGHSKNGCAKSLCMPRQYKDVHTNPDSDYYMLQVTTLNFIFIPVVMGMTLSLFTINVSTDMRHHRVRLVFQDTPLQRGKKRGDQGGTQVVLDPVHSVKIMDWWHPQYPSSPYI
ncbi:Transmembrane protein 183A [Liparis tanakae]|uniref:Transmembrane protein 183A n=1 Tax=Liparis tanakae TaxID=230148 RepID=A0A4Z2G9R9_9TELE|nr:Transmembrane protein 183A [Liparis tanakae]